MAELGGTFDPGAVSDDRELLPAGDQVAQIFESDLIRKDAAGNIVTDPNAPSVKSRAKFGWEIIAGPLAGRKLWTGENVQHPNAQTQEIGQRTLKRICEAAGTGPIKNTDALHFKPMIISITVDPAKGEYGPQNNIKGYKPYAAGVAPPPGGAVTAAASQPTTTPASSTPWPTR